MIETRTYDVEYDDVSLHSGTTDVTIRLTEGAESALFESLSESIQSQMEDGTVPDQDMHLFRRIVKQRDAHVPWNDSREQYRVYDLEMSGFDYVIFTECIGMKIADIGSVDGAGPYVELVDAWRNVTKQMKNT